MNLRARLQALRDDPVFMMRLKDSLLVTAVVMLVITSHTMAYQDEVLQEQMRLEHRAVEAQGAVWARLVAACANNGQFIYVDPHTGADIGVFCNAEMLGRIGR